MAGFENLGDLIRRDPCQSSAVILAFRRADFEHEIGTNFVVRGKGLVVLTSCSHRGVINTIRQAQAASGIQKVHAIIGGFHIVLRSTASGLAAVRDLARLMSPRGPNPDFLLGSRTSASAECRHWSGRAVRWSSCAILLSWPTPADGAVRLSILSTIRITAGSL